MKNAERRFENVVLRAVGPLVNGFETTTCPDTYVGLVSDLRSASADFPTRQESTSRPAAHCVALILESPHDKEFKGAPGPAKGATGVQIPRHLARLLQGEPRSFGLLLINAVQHQCYSGYHPGSTEMWFSHLLGRTLGAKTLWPGLGPLSALGIL